MARLAGYGRQDPRCPQTGDRSRWWASTRSCTTPISAWWSPCSTPALPATATVDIRWVDSETLTPENIGEVLAGLQRYSGAGRLRRPGHRGHDPGGTVRSGERRTLFRHLPGHADRGHRVRPPRRRLGRRPQRRVFRHHRPSCHRPDARSGGRHRQGRHHAAGQVPLRAGGRLPRQRSLRHGGDLGAAPPPV